MAKKVAKFTVDDHTRGRDPNVAATYAALIKAAKKLGPVTEEAKKTSIHLVRKSSRVLKHEQVSAGRWHLEVRLESPGDVDTEIAGWLKAGYELSG
jgi:hypothetical protein